MRLDTTIELLESKETNWYINAIPDVTIEFVLLAGKGNINKNPSSHSNSAIDVLLDVKGS